MPLLDCLSRCLLEQAMFDILESSFQFLPVLSTCYSHFLTYLLLPQAQKLIGLDLKKPFLSRNSRCLSIILLVSQCSIKANQFDATDPLDYHSYGQSAVTYKLNLL